MPFDGQVVGLRGPAREENLLRLGPINVATWSRLCPPPPLPPTPRPWLRLEGRELVRSNTDHGFQHVAIDGRSSLMIHVDGSLIPCHSSGCCAGADQWLSYFMSCARTSCCSWCSSRSSSRTLSADN